MNKNKAGGHCAPTNYALWMVLYEALQRQYNVTKEEKFNVDPKIGIYGIDAIGFRRSPGVLETILKDNNLDEHPIFAQHKLRGIRTLMGHTESTDVTNDVNGGPSGIGAANTAGKSLFWDKLQVPFDIKVKSFSFSLTNIYNNFNNIKNNYNKSNHSRKMDKNN